MPKTPARSRGESPGAAPSRTSDSRDRQGRQHGAAGKTQGLHGTATPARSSTLLRPARRLFGVRRVADGTHDGEARCPGVDGELGGGGVDAADRKPGHRSMLGRVPDEVQPDRRATRLGRSGEDGAHAEVVGIGRVDIARRVRREADGQAEPAHCRRRQVVLADVHEVGADELREVGTIVDDERNVVTPRHLTGDLEGRQQLTVGCALVANLHDVDAAANRGLQQVGKVRSQTGHEVQAPVLDHRGQPRRCVGGLWPATVRLYRFRTSPSAGLAAGDRAGDDERVSLLERNLRVAGALHGLAVALDEGVARGEPEPLEQPGDRLARLELVLPAVDDDADHSGLRAS